MLTDRLMNHRVCFCLNLLIEKLFVAYIRNYDAHSQFQSEIIKNKTNLFQDVSRWTIYNNCITTQTSVWNNTELLENYWIQKPSLILSIIMLKKKEKLKLIYNTRVDRRESFSYRKISFETMKVTWLSEGNILSALLPCFYEWTVLKNADFFCNSFCKKCGLQNNFVINKKNRRWMAVFVEP